MSRILTAAIGLVLRRSDRKLWGAFDAQAADPASAQQQVLREILAAQSSTTFGQQHRFDEIRNAADYAEAVDIHSYADLQPAIKQQEKHNTPELTVETPIIYAQTSGTTGTPKYIPITPSGLKRQARAQRLLASMVGRTTNIFSGSILGIGAPAVEGRLPSGKPYGSASGLIFDGMPRIIRSRYVLSDDVIGLDDHDQRYFEIARLSLAARDLTAIATANPSTFLRLHQVMIERWEELTHAVTAESPDRGGELRSLGSIEALPFTAIWPNLEVLTCWTCGSCGLALERLTPLLPSDIKLFELGYSASELRGSVATEAGRSDSVPLLGDVFFEFVERDEWESDHHNFIGLADLTRGSQYYVFVTTIDGLYRYHMNDIVQAVGHHHATPTIEFIQKGRGVTNITGEKVYENQLIAAMRRAGGGRLAGAGFFIGLADADRSVYRIFVEGPLEGSASELATRVDAHLAELNIEYASKRNSSRLGPLEIVEVEPGTAHGFRRHHVAAGQRDAQFKVQYLQPADKCTFDFEAVRVHR